MIRMAAATGNSATGVSCLPRNAQLALAVAVFYGTCATSLALVSIKAPAYPCSTFAYTTCTLFLLILMSVHVAQQNAPCKNKRPTKTSEVYYSSNLSCTCIVHISQEYDRPHPTLISLFRVHIVFSATFFSSAPRWLFRCSSAWFHEIFSVTLLEYRLFQLDSCSMPLPWYC